VISVSDRGPGIPDAMRASVFERFTHGGGTSPRGAGLGLAIVQAISEGHGGTVRVRGRDGGGTVFEMELPYAHPAPDVLGGTQSATPTAPELRSSAPVV
jgi:signal transduction histidine kinase